MPISLLALGDLGWMQVTNFLGFGLLMAGFALGLAQSADGRADPSRWGAVLVGIFAAGIVAAGLFAADPGGGYPPSSQASSGTGTLHDLATLVVFVALIAAAAVFAWAFARKGRTRWAVYSALSSALVVLGFVLTIVAFNGTGNLSDVAGLVQRLTVLVGWTWLTLLALDARRRFDRPGQEGPAPIAR
jgi:hypothetical protein